MLEERTATDWAWAAGFFDGEGCVSFDPANGQLALIVNQVDERPIKKFAEITSIPHRGPFQRSKNQPIYTWAAYKNSEVLRVLDGLWPYLSGLKKDAASEKLRLRADWKMKSDLQKASASRQILILDGIESVDCSKCRIVKPLTEFHRNSSRRLGFNHYCKDCKRCYDQNGPKREMD